MVEIAQAHRFDDLIPGDAEEVLHAARGLATYADVLHTAGAGLRGIDTSDGWRGEAADAFHEFYHGRDGQPRKWLIAGDAFRDAAAAVHDYSHTLSWAQRQATEAIHLRQKGQEHHGPAHEILTSARSQLEDAGDRAARKVGAARDKAPAAPGLASRIGSSISHGLETAGSALKEGVADCVNGAASLTNATANHPGDTAAALGGIALAGLGAAGDITGTGLVLTGVGAGPGVALDGVATVGVVAGAGITSTAAGDVVKNAAGSDHVTLMKAKKNGSGGNSSSDSYASRPGSISQKTGYGRKDITDAIHSVKNNGGWRGNGGNKNPDIIVETDSGEVYPQRADGSPADDSIGNIYDYLDNE